MGAIDPAVLRADAADLRSLARAIGSSAALDLHRRAGADTWTGRLAAACHAELIAMRVRLLDARDSALRTAAALERRARELERSAHR